MHFTLRNLFATIGFSLLAVPQGQAAEDPAAVVQAANTQWNQALNSGNTKALAALYAEDAMLSPGNGATLTGRAEIEKLFQGFVDNGVHNHQLETLYVSGDAKHIYQVARWSANGAEKDGKKPAFGGITTNLLEKGADGQWRSRTHVWNAGN